MSRRDQRAELNSVRLLENNRTLEYTMTDGYRFCVTPKQRGDDVRWHTPGGSPIRERGLETRRDIPWQYLRAVADVLSVCVRRMDGLETRIRSQVKAEFAQQRAELDAERTRISQQARETERSIARMTPGRHGLLHKWRAETPAPATERPDCLRGVRNVKRLEPLVPCHVYFLILRDEVVYVGQTASKWPARIEQHVKDGDKEFDDVWYLEVDRQSLKETEEAFIRHFRPRYNGTHVVHLEAPNA